MCYGSPGGNKVKLIKYGPRMVYRIVLLLSGQSPRPTFAPSWFLTWLSWPTAQRTCNVLVDVTTTTSLWWVDASSTLPNLHSPSLVWRPGLAAWTSSSMRRLLKVLRWLAPTRGPACLSCWTSGVYPNPMVLHLSHLTKTGQTMNKYTQYKYSHL